jgi:hypothetical protein
VVFLYQQYFYRLRQDLLLDYRPTRAAVLCEQKAVPEHPTPMRY